MRVAGSIPLLDNVAPPVVIGIIDTLAIAESAQCPIQRFGPLPCECKPFSLDDYLLYGTPLSATRGLFC
jgi:hypothetical protein